MKQKIEKKMKEKNNQPLIIIAIVALLLAIASFFPKEVKIATISVKPIDMFSDIRAESTN